MPSIAGKVVLITGASAGIGAACARLFAAEGCHIILLARRLQALEHVRDQIAQSHPSVKLLLHQVDVTDAEGVADFIQRLDDFWSNIDILVLNAGLALGLEHVIDTPPQHIDQMFDTNVKGVLNFLRVVVPGMKIRNSGTIVIVGSIAGREVYPGGGVYCASKHAVDAVVRTLRIELNYTPLRVIAIDPGMVETEFSKVRFQGDEVRAKAAYDGLTPLDPEDIAEAIVFASSRRENVQIASMTIFPSAQASVSHIHRKRS